MEGNIPQGFPVYALPTVHNRRMRTSNAIEPAMGRKFASGKFGSFSSSSKWSLDVYWSGFLWRERGGGHLSSSCYSRVSSWLFAAFVSAPYVLFDWTGQRNGWRFYLNCGPLLAQGLKRTLHTVPKWGLGEMV
jgi:hypothetical protein